MLEKRRSGIFARFESESFLKIFHLKNVLFVFVTKTSWTKGILCSFMDYLIARNIESLFWMTKHKIYATQYSRLC